MNTLVNNYLYNEHCEEEFRIPVVVDDYGNSMSLVKYKAKGKRKLTDIEINGEKKASFSIREADCTRVINDRPHTWSNGVVARNNLCFWKGERKELIKKNVNGYDLVEVIEGRHAMEKYPNNHRGDGDRTIIYVYKDGVLCDNFKEYQTVE